MPLFPDMRHEILNVAYQVRLTHFRTTFNSDPVEYCNSLDKYFVRSPRNADVRLPTIDGRFMHVSNHVVRCHTG